MSKLPRPSDDYFDSRDIIEGIEELKGLVAEDPDDEDAQELLDQYLALQDEAEGYVSDWKYGEAFISEAYFTDYARQLAEDIGAIERDAGWPCGYIDWEMAAEALKMDYTSYSFGGYTYYAR